MNNKQLSGNINTRVNLVKGSIQGVMGSYKRWVVRVPSIEFPTIGEDDVIYIATDQDNKTYVWDSETRRYRLIMADISESDLKNKLDRVTIICES